VNTRPVVKAETDEISQLPANGAAATVERRLVE
jgi:hypothetical protein